jgi:hypothetical protein
MHHQLKTIYIIILSPALACFIAVCVLRQIYPSMDMPVQTCAFIAPMIFILSAVFAVASPILYRSFFAHSHRHVHDVPPEALFIFERNLTGMTLVTPYLALVAYFLQLPRFYLAATLLMALYAVYYTYPSHKRVAFDEKIFRTHHVMPVDPTH